MIQHETEEQATIDNTHLPALALMLFDKTTATHQMGARARRLLSHATIAYAAARQGDAAGAPRRARDTLLAQPIDNLSGDDQKVAASVAALQRPKQRMRRETAFIALSSRDQALAQRLAAILRLTSGLSAHPLLQFAIDTNADGTVIHANIAPEEIDTHADRWRKSIGQITIEPLAPEAEMIDTAALEASELPFAEVDALRADEPFAEGARRMLRRMFDRMLAREDGVAQGEDPEDVHQMRVAIRRLRASLQVTERLFDPKRIRRFRRKLRRMALCLGDVRDWDVFLGTVNAYSEALPDDERVALTPLTDAIGRQRALAREALVHELASERYTAFKHEFARFLTTSSADTLPLPPTGQPLLVRDGAGSAIWERYEQWRAFDVIIREASETQLHEARIAGKRLRYTLEFFADALGPKVDDALTPLTALQELLGTMQDDVVAREHVNALSLADDAGAIGFLAYQAAASTAHTADLPRTWEKVVSATYRRRLWEMISRL